MFVDFHLGIPPRDLYDVNDVPEFELFELMAFLLYCPFAYLFAYLYDRWKIRGLGTTVYVFGWSVLAAVYEGIALYFHVYTYKNWNLGYSFLFYLIVQSLTLFIYHVIKQNYNRTKQATGQEWT